MTVLELCESCSNTGVGTIKVINMNHVNDEAKFNDLSELNKTSIRNFEVSTWEFIPKRKIGAIDWEFVLEIIIK